MLSIAQPHDFVVFYQVRNTGNKVEGHFLNCEETVLAASKTEAANHVRRMFGHEEDFQILSIRDVKPHE